MKMVLQNSNQDCLLACYCMILSSKKINIHIYELYDEEIIPPDGLSAKYLQKLNSRFNLTMHVYKSTGEDILEGLRQETKPYIVQWKTDHFIVVEKLSGAKVKIIDPAYGKMTLTLDEFKQGYSGYVICFTKSGNYISIKKDNFFYKHLISVFKGKNIIFYLIALLLTQFSSIIFSILVREILKNTMPTFYLIFFLVCLISGRLISYIIERSAQTATNLKFENSISKKMFNGLLSRSFLYFRNNPTGTLLEKLNLRTVVRDSILFHIIPSVINFLSVFVLFIYLIYISPILSLITGILILFFIIINYFMYKYRLSVNMRYIQSLIQTSTIFQEDLDQIDVIKALGLEGKYNESWSEASLTTQKTYNRLLQINSLSNFLGQTFLFTTITTILIVGVLLVNHYYITIADLVVFQTTASMFINATTQVQQSFFEFGNIDAYGEKMSELFQYTKDKELKIIQDKKSNIAIEAKNLSYKYTGGQVVIKGSSFLIKKGEKIVIIGKSGSGKTTLLSLMLGIVKGSGSIQFGYADFRKKIGIVLQGMTLRKGTVLENLYDGKLSNEKIKEIEVVLQNLNILNDINNLPKKIYSQLFQQGKNLSGGQVQRLLIAKSLVNDNEIIFWDEAFSSLDNLNRELLYKNILNNDKYNDKTFIMVSHHLDVVSQVDRVLFVDNHTVKLQPHSVLWNSSEAYRKFIKTGEL
ncbi:ATP-binding cassette domain-containing protein [Leuconostoc gelidum subsp. gasicomitatum]|uniref:cysteine peptidase family C39 domain-containing protein n=2 Tax=Leuconostoc gasicomitatum TaxID=115778 RepID=UPI001CC6449E|nr:cysteine peptidase family C39 domain-containing protein [Leuconostoc gasicomitatum]MBZ5952548.1 ATP-binding cassette domain-containing protein [Leuconostoc gasicomitatum]